MIVIVHFYHLKQFFSKILISFTSVFFLELSSGDEMLTLNSDRSVTGRYRCRASNGKQAEQTLDINVDIQCKNDNSI